MLEALERAMRHENGNITAVANKAGVSRTALSLILRGKYPANPKKILGAVRVAYAGVREGSVRCPALGDEISCEVCRRNATAVRTGEVLSGLTFQWVKNTCPTCENY